MVEMRANLQPRISTAQTPMLRPDTTRPYRNPLSLTVCRTAQRVSGFRHM